MASGQTQYYGLSQWEAVDKVERVDFNSDNAKIDGALHALAEQAGQKADRSAVDSLSNVVEQKADKTALSAAEGRISDLESGKADKTELAALGAEVHHLSESLCWVRLGSWTLAASASSLDLDLSRIPAEQYARLRLVYTISAPSVTSLRVQLNRVTGAVYHCQSSPGRGDIRLGDSLEGSSSFRETAAGEVEFFSLGSVGTGVLGQGCSRDRNSFWGFGSVGLASGAEFEDLSAIRLFCSEPMNKGGSFILYGLQR